MEKEYLFIVGLVILVGFVVITMLMPGQMYNSDKINKINDVASVDNGTLIIDYGNLTNQTYNKICFTLNQSQVCFNESGKV